MATPVYTDVFALLTVRDLRSDEMLARYVDWILGTASKTKRDRRANQGVSSDWTYELLRAERSLVGTRGCSVDLRETPDTAVLRFIHRDGPDNDSTRHSVVRLTKLPDGGTRLEHGLGRHFIGKGVPMHPNTMPSVVTWLFTEERDIEPKELRAPFQQLHEDDVERFVAEKVLSPTRITPIIVVSCDSDEGPPLIYAAWLSKLLRGIATVVELPTPASTFAWGAATAERFGKHWRCFDGSVRLCGPAASADRPWGTQLWDGRIFRDPELTVARATSRLATAIARRVSWRAMDRDFFGLIEDIDARAPR